MVKRIADRLRYMSGAHAGFVFGVGRNEYIDLQTRTEVALHVPGERSAVILLDPEEPYRTLVETGVPCLPCSAREGDHRPAEPQPRPEPATGSHAAQGIELRFVGSASRVARRVVFQPVLKTMRATRARASGEHPGDGSIRYGTIAS